MVVRPGFALVGPSQGEASGELAERTAPGSCSRLPAALTACPCRAHGMRVQIPRRSSFDKLAHRLAGHRVSLAGLPAWTPAGSLAAGAPAPLPLPCSFAAAAPRPHGQAGLQPAASRRKGAELAALRVRTSSAPPRQALCGLASVAAPLPRGLSRGRVWTAPGGWEAACRAASPWVLPVGMGMHLPSGLCTKPCWPGCPGAQNAQGFGGSGWPASLLWGSFALPPARPRLLPLPGLALRVSS